MEDRHQPPSTARRKRSLAADLGAAEGAAAGDPRSAADGAPSFELALERLETLVGGLENGELSLEQALADFEEGVRLSRRLADQLTDAERRIERLTVEGGLLTTRPLQGDEGSE